MISFLDKARSILVAQGARDEEVNRLFAGFKSEASAKDRSMPDIIRAKRELAAIDREYADALDVADAKVFARRYPELV